MKDAVLCPYCKQSKVNFERTFIDVDYLAEYFYAFCPCCKTRHLLTFIYAPVSIP